MNRIGLRLNVSYGNSLWSIDSWRIAFGCSPNVRHPGPDEHAQLERGTNVAATQQICCRKTAANTTKMCNKPWLHSRSFLFLYFPPFYTNFKAITNSRPIMNSESLCNCPKNLQKMIRRGTNLLLRYRSMRFKRTNIRWDHIRCCHVSAVRANKYSLRSHSLLLRLCHVSAVRANKYSLRSLRCCHVCATFQLCVLVWTQVHSQMLFALPSVTHLHQIWWHGIQHGLCIQR